MPSNFINTNTQKSKQRRDLRRFFVEVEDESPKSSKFLNISQLGDEFSLGKNAFIIRGSGKVVPGAPVLVEILDSENEVIYSETHEYEESGGRIISVYVYEDTPTGPAQITIMTEVNEDLRGDSISEDSQGVYNYRWTQTVNVNPNVYNINNVRFERSPEVRAESVTLNKYEVSYGQDDTREAEFDSKSDFGSSNLALTGLLNLEEHENKLSVLEIDESCGSKFSLLRGMEGGTITFRNVKDEFNLDEDVCNEYDIGPNQSFTFDIERILNRNTLRLKSRESVRDSLPRRIELDCNDNFVINFLREDPTSVTKIDEPSCFVQLELDNLATISGAVLRSSVYVRQFDSDNPYTFVGDFELDPQELLVDFENPNTRRQKRTGLFLEQDDVDTYLRPLNTHSVLERDNDNLLNSVNVKRDTSQGTVENLGYNTQSDEYGGAQILGSINQVIKRSQGSSTSFSFDDSSDAVLGFKIPMFGSSGDIRLEENVSYNLSFTYLLNNRGNEYDDSRFGVFLRFRRMDEEGREYEVEERLEDFKVVNDEYGFAEVDLEFESLTSSLTGDYCDLQLIIKIEDGNWFFSDFSLIPSQKPGFSPDFTTISFNLDSSILESVDNPLEFRTDLFDLNKNRIPVDLRTSSGLDISDCGTISGLPGGHE